MKYIIILQILFLSSCSLTETDYAFFENITGTYDVCLSSYDPDQQISISKPGHFRIRNQQYTFLTAISSFSAYYKIDDISYVGILIHKDGTLKQVYSLTTDTNGIPPFTDNKLFTTIAKKINK